MSEQEKGGSAGAIRDAKIGRSKAGRPRAFETADDLIAAAEAYFAWAEANPIFEVKAFSTGVMLRVPHPRPLTQKAMCLFLGITERTFQSYRDQYEEACEYIDSVIYDNKYTGAAVGMFNPSIIARDLGLADKKDVESNLTVLVQDTFDDDDD